MRKTVFTVALGLLLSLLLATAQAAEPLVYAGLPWGANAVAIKAKMAAAGFTFEKLDPDGDLVFRGAEVLNTPATAFAILHNDRLVKMQVLLLTPDREAIRIYERMLETLSGKYGKPEKTFAFFQKPYYDGDGYAEQAIRNGKGHFMAGWSRNTDTPTQSSILLRITDRLAVSVSYEGPEWPAVLKQRTATSTRSF